MRLGSVVWCTAGRGRNGWWEQTNGTDGTYVIPLKFLAAATITCPIFRHPLTVFHLHTRERDPWRRPGYEHCRFHPKFYTQSEREIEWRQKKENIIKKQAPTTQNSTLSQIDFRVSMATNGPRWPETSGTIDAGRDELTASRERRKYQLFPLSRTSEVASSVFVSFC
jgi:hypothetical protein